MIELKDDQLVVNFPEVHPHAQVKIEFQRTLRIPDDNRSYPLPPGLGRFPLNDVDDYHSQLPASWEKHGGVFLPMYQSEALWINFHGLYPMAIKIAAGKINAVTGDPWSNTLHNHPQDYVVIPDQPWVDGFNIAESLIRQFVAMPLGSCYTMEEQLIGEGQYGGLQFIIYPMKSDWYEEYFSSRNLKFSRSFNSAVLESRSTFKELGLAPGGLMKQKIYNDQYGIDAWDRGVYSRCYAHIANSEQYESITGNQPPHRAPTASDYTASGLPWFDYYDETQTAVRGSKKLSEADSLGAKIIKEGQPPLQDNKPVSPKEVVDLFEKKRVIREWVS